MDPYIYEILDAVPETYWRYVARHQLFLNLWERHREQLSVYRVLDVGCGSGGLLSYLAKRAAVIPIGVDMFLHTLSFCRRRGIDALGAADARALPFGSDRFDFVIAQDVVEHVPDDSAVLAELCRVCAPGGLVLILAPAFDSLWSTRDVRLHHHRRYTLNQLSHRVQEAGFDLVRRTYIDMFLLPLLWVAIFFAPRTPGGVADISADAPGSYGLLNQALLAISRLEAAVVRHVDLPFGVSAVVLARKPLSDQGR
jgi:SAM-dependent methyltransferase